MKKIKNRFLTVCALFAAALFCFTAGIVAAVDGKDDFTPATAEASANTEVMNENWTATPTIRWDLWNSMYKVTLNYTSAFNPTATWANDHETINGINVRDYLVFNGETLSEIMAKGETIDKTYPVANDEGMIDNGAAWNPVSVCVNTNNIDIQINRNYLAPGGLEFGIKAGFEMTNNGTLYKTTEDVMFKLIPDVSIYDSGRGAYDSLKAVPLEDVEITTSKSTVTYSRAETKWDKTNYICYHIVSTALMNYGDFGTVLCDHNTYLNDYITINGQSLAYWNTVTYKSTYNYSGAPSTGRAYATPTFAGMHQGDTSTTIAVYLNNDWIADQGITDPVLGIKDGMLYVGRDGATICKYINAKDYDMSFVEGASVRAVVDNNAETGIRFTANVDTKLATEATEVGMLIVPETYITAYKASGYSDYFKYFSEVKGKTKAGISTTFSAAQIASGTLKGCIVGIKDENWTRSYQAVTYYIADGEYYYSEPSDARSITYVADKALTDTTADYSNGLKTALANIIGKSLTPTSAEISGKYEDTFDVNEKFKFNVSGDTSWSVVSGTAVTLSGTTATIVESGTVTLRFSAYGGQLTKDVTLTVTCQMFSIKGYGGGAAATGPAFCLDGGKTATNFVKGAFYINDTTNTTNGKMILNGEEKVVFQGGDYNPGNGLYQFTSLVSGITLSVGDVITLEKGTTFSQGDSVYYLSETTCLKYYNANNWVVYTVDGEITLNAYTGNASMAASQPAFSINGETKFEAGWFYINNTAQNTNGNMLLNGEEKVVFKAGYYYTNTNSYQFQTLADGITFSEGDVITLKKGTTFSQGVGTIVYVLSKNVDLTYTGTSWTVENYDGKISVSNYYGGAAATGPAFCLDGGKTATNFVKGAFYINDTTNTTNGKMILNGEEKVVFQGGDYNPDNGAYQFVNRADGITLSVGDVITLKKGTTFSQGSLVYVFSKDVYLTCTDAVGQGSWAVNDEQTFTLNEEKDAYAYTDNLVDNLVIGATLAIDGDEAVDVIVHGGITVDGSAAALTAQYYPSISKFVLTGEGLTGSVAIAAGTIFVINGEAYVLEKDFSCDVSEIFIDNANASYYTFADMAPRGTKALIQEYYDMGLSTYQLTQDCHQMVYNDALDSSYLAAIDNAYQLGGSTIIRNIGNLGKNGSNEYIYKDGSTSTTYDKDKIDKITATAKYFDDYGKALMDACDDKISAFYMADEFTSEEFAQLGDLITWKNENASDKLWHMNLVGSLSYDHWEVSYSGSWLDSITNKVDREKAQATYGTHVDDYINTIVKKLKGGTASVCLDCYPFRERDEETGVGDIYDYYLFDLLTAATKTKAYNDSRTDTTNSAEARFGICLQTYQFINPSSSALQRDIASSAEVSMQIYTGLAMGADLFQYFTYCSQYYEDGSVKTNGIMTQTPFDGNGGTTIADSKRLYDMVKTANGNALPFAKITSAFDWQGTFYTAGSTSENGTAFGRIGDLVTSNKGAMTSCSSTFDALYGRYTKSSQDGFMVVNYTDPTKAHTNTVTMNFSGYNYAIVYTAGGTAKLVALNSDGGLSLSLATGEAAFVIPMK